MSVVCTKWTLPIAKLCALLGLDRTEVIASTGAVVYKVSLSKSLLEVLTSFGLESSIVWQLLVASARALGDAFVVLLVLATHDQVMGIYFSSFCRLHQLVSLCCCTLTCLSILTRAEVAFKVMELSLVGVGVLSQ